MCGKEILKPCPFCGGKAYFDRDEHGWEWIECEKCHVATNQRVSLMEDCKPLLAEAWNTRTASSTIDHEAIRAEAQTELAKKIVEWPEANCTSPWMAESNAYYEIIDYCTAILADEPKEREAEIPDTGRRVRCNHCMSEFDEAYIDINATNHDSGETCPVCGKGDALMDLERKLKEVER